MRLIIFLFIAAALMVGCRQNSNTAFMTPGLTLSAQELIVNADAGPANAPSKGTLQLATLSLNQAIEIAEQSHPALALALSRIEESKGAVLQAGLSPNPSLIARMESARTSGQTTDNAEYIVGLSQDIPLGDRIDAAVEVAQKRQDALSIAMKVERLEIRRQVQVAYADAWYWNRAADLWNQAVEDAQKNRDFARARLNAGESIATELAQVEVELQRTQLARDKVRASQEQAVAMLLHAMGHPDAEIGSLENWQNTLSLGAPHLEQMLSRLETNVQLQAIQAELVARQARLKLAQERRKPDVSVDVLYHHLDDHASAVDVGLSLPLPLFDRNQGKIHESRAALISAHIQSDRLRQDLEHNLRQSHSRLRVALQSARSLQDTIVPQSRKLLSEVENRYHAGDVSMADVLIIRRDAVANQLDLLETLRNVLQAKAELLLYLE